MRRGGGALLALLCLVAVAPQAALGAPAWVAPSDLSAPGRDAAEPAIAIDPAGSSVAVWSRFDGGHWIVQSAARPAGGAWSPAVDLSLPGRDAKEPRIAVDAAGNAVAVWQRHNGSHTIIQGSRRPAGRAWAPAADLSAAGRDADEPRLAVSAGGEAIAVWSRFNGLDRIVQAATGTAAGWAPAADLSELGENAEEPAVATDPAGNAVAAWARSDGSDLIVQASSRAAGGGWSIPADLSEEGENATEPQVDMSPSGEAIAIWSRFDGIQSIVQSASRSGAGVWLPAIDASEAGHDAAEPQVALGHAGRAAAIWTRTDIGPYSVVQAGERGSGEAWSEPADLTASGQSVEDPRIGLDPDGGVVAIWARSSGAPTVVEGRLRPAGAGWLAPVTISVIGRTAVEPELALDPAGNGVATWARDDDLNSIAQAAGFDGAGPLIGGLSIPSAATVGEPLDFAVGTFDVWSPIGAIGWGFGDGAAAPGARVSHSYERPGVYPVTVTVADAIGNGAAAGGAVTVYRKPSAGRNVRVRRGRALLRLRCPSPAGCSGALRLVAAVELRRGRRLISKRRQIGRRVFRIPGARRSTVPVRLTKVGRRAVAGTGRRGLRTQLTGPGVRHRLVHLFGKRKTRRGRNDGPRRRRGS